jgi:hypothetical protein
MSREYRGESADEFYCVTCPEDLETSYSTPNEDEAYERARQREIDEDEA